MHIPAKRTSNESILSLTAFYLTLFFLAVAALFVHRFFHFHEESLNELKPLLLHPELLLPEPEERTLYIILVLSLLPFSIASIKITEALREASNVHCAQRKDSISTYLQISLILTVPVLLAASFWRSAFIFLMLGEDLTKLKWTFFIVHALVSVLLLFLFIHPEAMGIRPKRVSFLPSRTATAVLTVFLVGSILISVLSFRIQSVSMVNEHARWINHFEPVFYPISQVMGGKTLLADLPSQYGLYPEILKPVFSIIPLSVLNFTVIMSLLQIVGLLALLWVCFQLVRNNVLRLFCMLCGLIVIGGTWSPINFAYENADPYYQYWPVRFIFPALSVAVFLLAVKRRLTIKYVVAMALLGAVAMVWNLDSGVPIVGSLIACLAMQTIFPPDDSRGHNFKKLLLAGATVVVFLAGFAFYLQHKAGEVIDWNRLFKYQQIFYKAGYAMLPMPTHIHPWMVVAGYYGFGIVCALYMRIRRKPSLTWEIIFYLSVLGLGLFAYYQGRSHEFVLIVVMWPAILIAFILADRTLRAVRGRVLPAFFSWSVYPVIVFGLILTGVFISGLPVLKSMTVNNLNAVLNPLNTPVTANVQFIRQHVDSSNKAVILSTHQAVYFAETRMTSAVNGPGLIETLLVADRERMLNSLLTTPEEHLFIQPDENGEVPPIFSRLLRRYIVKSQSEHGILYLEPKSILEPTLDNKNTPSKRRLTQGFQ